MKKYIRAEILNMAKGDILRLVPEETLERIKESDSSPEIRAYVIGHEGKADSGIVEPGGVGRRILRYVREAIVQLYDRIENGLKIFHDHATDNLHHGREQIGEVVGKVLDTIDGKLSTIAAVYIFPQYKRRKLDIASIEANITMTEGEGETSDVLSVDDVTGIALGNSRINRPGFPGATLLGTVQAFTAKKKDEEEEEPMKISEIKDAIKEGKFKITDLYTDDEICDSEPAKKAKQTEYEHAKRVEKKLGEERDRVIELSKTNETLETELKGLRAKESQRGVKDLYGEAVEKRKFNDKQKAFIEKRLERFKSEEKDDKLKDDFNRYLDSELKEYEETAKLFGVDGGSGDDDKGKGGNDDKKGSGNGDGKAGGGSDTPNDLTLPDNNEFIPKV